MTAEGVPKILWSLHKAEKGMTKFAKEECSAAQSATTLNIYRVNIPCLIQYHIIFCRC